MRVAPRCIGFKGKGKGDDLVRVPVMGAEGLSPQHGVVV